MSRARGSRLIALVAGAALLASCDDATPVATSPPAASGSPDAAPPARATPVADDATVALVVNRLLAEWRDLPDGRERDDVVADLAALGLPGFERVLLGLDTTSEPMAFALLSALIERLGPDSLDVTARAIATPGRLRTAGLSALGQSRKLHWAYDEHGPAVARALLVALDDPDAETRRNVLIWLGLAGPTGVAVAEQIVARLVDEEARGRAIDALRFLGPAAAPAIPSLLEAIRTADRRRWSDLFAVLGEMSGGSQANVEATLKLLDGDDHKLRAAIARAVGSWHDHSDVVVPRLIAMLHDGGDGVAGAAREGLECLARHRSAARLLQDCIARLPPADAALVVPLAYRDDVAALSAVAPRLLTIADPALRTATLRTLNDLAVRSLDPSLLVPLLEDASASVRVEASLLLIRMDPAAGKRAVAAAAAAASDSDQCVRETAARVLAAAANSGVVSPALIPLLADQSDSVEFAVYSALEGSSVPIGAVPPEILARVMESALVWGLPTAADVALRIEGGTEALVRAASAALESSDTDRVRKALLALAAAGPAANSAASLVAPFMSRADTEREARVAYFKITGDVTSLGDDYEVDENEARRLLERGDAGADAIVRWASRVAPWARARLCATLGENETLARAVRRGASALGTEDERVRARTGATGLAPVLGTRRAIDLVDQLADDPSDEVRRAAAATLSSLGDGGADLAPAADALRALLRDANEHVRLDAVLASRRLAQLRTDVRARLTDQSPAVRLQAASALLADGCDAEARKALFEALQHVERNSGVCDADWPLVETALARAVPAPAEAPILATALSELDDCSCQAVLLRALTRLGPDATSALRGIRAALASDTPCRWGTHVEHTNRADAIAALAAIGPAASPAIPDLTVVAARDPEFAASARAAIVAISGASR